MRAFLTGGTGFIGGEVTRLLPARDDDVRTPRPLSEGPRDLVPAP